MTTTTGKLFQIGTILEEKKYLLRLHLLRGTVSLYDASPLFSVAALHQVMPGQMTW